MPNNRAQVLSRLESIKKRFIRDMKYREDYKKFMNDLVEKGYARKVVDESANTDSDVNVWYLPHHGVYHPHKPDKIRVVFDCSCQYAGKSLNKELLQGPDLTSSLIGVLIRFRQERVAFMADMESMFYQVRIPESQVNYLRFVWWPDGDISTDPDDYQMRVHLFGAVSSPSCANFALRKTADDNEEKYGATAANMVRRNFYVDDLLASVETVSDAVDALASVQQMCAAGGFRLTKFLSNDCRVIETIPVSNRASNFKDIDLSKTTLPMERVLGVHWSIENDTLDFRITLKDRPPTRRGILATISSIYDPLGLASPFLLAGKQLLQRLCGRRLDWDEVICDEDRGFWERWRLCLPYLEKIRVDRCFRPSNGFNTIISSSLHHFSDASQTGYGQCSYLRRQHTLFAHYGKIKGGTFEANYCATIRTDGSHSFGEGWQDAGTRIGLS